MSTAGGMTSHPLYRRWYDMNRRCLDPKRKDFHHYGGRGISVCEDWIRSNPNGFTNFLSDMEASYVEGLELDRVDNNGNYDKYNCKWSTRSEQVVNSRTLECKIGEIHWLNDGEETLHLAAMAKKYNMSQFKLHDRIVKLGWTLEEALTRKHKVKSYSIVIEGTSYKLNDIFVTNLSNRAKGCKISTRDMLRSIFSESVKIFAKINGKEVEVLSNVNIGKHAPILVKDNMFVKYFKPEYNILVGSEDAV